MSRDSEREREKEILRDGRAFHLNEWACKGQKNSYNRERTWGKLASCSSSGGRRTRLSIVPLLGPLFYMINCDIFDIFIILAPRCNSSNKWGFNFFTKKIIGSILSLFSAYFSKENPYTTNFRIIWLYLAE